MVIFLLALLGYQHPIEFDVTENKTNSLSKNSREILSKLSEPLKVDFFTADRNMQRSVSSIIELFQKENKNINFDVHYTALDPQEKLKLGIQTNHNLVLTYENRKKAIDLNLAKWNELVFSNLIYQILQEKEQWIIFLSGHGELNPVGVENQNLSLLTTELKSKGLKVAALNLGDIGIIPDNTQLLIIAAPKTAYLSQEMSQIMTYLKHGGHLLWLYNPNAPAGFEPLAKALGIQIQTKTIIDPKSHQMGTPHPAMTIINRYPAHPITETLESLTVFPFAAPIIATENDMGYEIKPLLTTNNATHLEGKAGARQSFTIGVTLTKGAQRIVVLGNSHFLSNAHLQSYGNLTLATRLFDWLNENEPFMIQDRHPTVDPSFTQNVFTKVTLQILFPYVCSLGYLLIGWYIKRNRYKKYLL